MKSLEEARKDIDAVDRQIAALFEQRMDAVRAVAEYKRANGLPIFDSSREQEILNSRSQLIENPEIRSYYVDMQRNMMNVSKQYQHRILEGMSVAYSGVEGAFANIAAQRIFPDGHLESFADFQAAYDAVVEGICDVAVLPVENSYAGEVSQVIDLMFAGELYVNGVYNLRINQNLLAVKGASLAKIKKVVSHPQALSQCAGFIKEHGFEVEEATNTARAAAAVAQAGDPTVAAIASMETARLYDLDVVARNINESALNTTRFAVFSRAENESRNRVDNKFMMLFAVNNVAGALANAINIIGKYDFNMLSLRSHPMKGQPWQYYFYVEAEGDECSEQGKAMLAELGEQCERLKIVGHYTAESELEDR